MNVEKSTEREEVLNKMAVADGREIYVLGKNAWGNRELKVVEDGETHDMPADAEYAYTSDLTKFPYEIPA